MSRHADAAASQYLIAEQARAQGFCVVPWEDFVRDWFATHWPTATFNADELAREIARNEYPSSSNGWIEATVEKLLPIIRRHALPVGTPVVVEVTGEDLHAANIACESPFAVHILNARLRARAGIIAGEGLSAGFRLMNEDDPVPASRPAYFPSYTDCPPGASAEELSRVMKAQGLPPALDVGGSMTPLEQFHYDRGYRAGKIAKVATDTGPAKPALDVEAVAREIADEYRNYLHTREVAAILRRHATDTGWVQCPTTQTAGELVVPEDGEVLVEWMDGRRVLIGANAINPADHHLIWRWCVPGQPWIERTPTTTRAWTAESVQACVKSLVAVFDEDGDDGIRRFKHNSAEGIATMFNEDKVVRFCIIPQDGPR